MPQLFLPCAGGVVEERHERGNRLGLRDHPQPDLGGDAERSLRAHEGAEQVISGGVAVELDERAVAQHHVEGGDVIGREAVLEAVRAAGVLGDVAADRARDLARGIGRIEMGGGDGARDRQVGHSRLDDDAAVVEVDRQDPPHPREHDEHTFGDRQRPARQPGPRAARDPRHAGLVASPHDSPHLAAGAGQDRGDRRLAVVAKSVRAVRGEVVRVGEHVPGATDVLESVDQLGRAGGHRHAQVSLIARRVFTAPT